MGAPAFVAPGGATRLYSPPPSAAASGAAAGAAAAPATLAWWGVRRPVSGGTARRVRSLARVCIWRAHRHVGMVARRPPPPPPPPPQPSPTTLGAATQSSGEAAPSPSPNVRLAAARRYLSRLVTAAATSIHVAIALTLVLHFRAVPPAHLAVGIAALGAPRHGSPLPVPAAAAQWVLGVAAPAAAVHHGGVGFGVVAMLAPPLFASLVGLRRGGGWWGDGMRDDDAHHRRDGGDGSDDSDMATTKAAAAQSSSSPPHPGWAWAGLAWRGWALGGWARAAVGYGPWHRAGWVLNGVLWVAEAVAMAVRRWGGERGAEQEADGGPPGGGDDGHGR
ncbi:hypothetical protein MMPV_003918 [Pyropia vietnamensis]